VAERGVVVWQGSRGLADLESHTAITSETSFDIASISKQFIATGVLLLEQAGQLSRSDPLSKHVPGMPGWAHRVTLAQLMHHSSGIPNYFGDLAPKGWEHATLTQQDALAKISAQGSCDFSLAPSGSIQISTTYSSAWSSSTSAASRWKPFLGSEYSTRFSFAWSPTPASR
jgi:CubicO group peptidase (beta-lactamase class C family)